MIPIKPMLAVSGKAFSSKGWIFEPKIDGARCIAYISNNAVELKNRRMRSIAYLYPEIIRALKQAASDCVLAIREYLNTNATSLQAFSSSPPY